MLPNDPVILMSLLNSYLRDKYSSLDELCEDLGADRREIEAKVLTISYEYDEKLNQFV